MYGTLKQWYILIMLAEYYKEHKHGMTKAQIQEGLRPPYKSSMAALQFNLRYLMRDGIVKKTIVNRDDYADYKDKRNTKIHLFELDVMGWNRYHGFDMPVMKQMIEAEENMVSEESRVSVKTEEKKLVVSEEEDKLDRLMESVNTDL
jgi:hypothetical protein